MDIFKASFPGGTSGIFLTKLTFLCDRPDLTLQGAALPVEEETSAGSLDPQSRVDIYFRPRLMKSQKVGN